MISALGSIDAEVAPVCHVSASAADMASEAPADDTPVVAAADFRAGGLLQRLPQSEQSVPISQKL